MYGDKACVQMYGDRVCAWLKSDRFVGVQCSDGLVLGFMVTCVWVAGVWGFWWLYPKSEKSGKVPGLPAASGDNGWQIKLTLQGFKFIRNTLPLSNCLASPLGSNLGMSESVFGYSITASAVAMIGCPSQSVPCDIEFMASRACCLTSLSGVWSTGGTFDFHNCFQVFWCLYGSTKSRTLMAGMGGLV